jgi:hypothetical protein
MTELIEQAASSPEVEPMDDQRQISVMCKMAMFARSKKPLVRLNRLDAMLGESIEHWCIKGSEDKMALIAEWKPFVLEYLKSLF